DTILPKTLILSSCLLLLVPDQRPASRHPERRFCLARGIKDRLALMWGADRVEFYLSFIWLNRSFRCGLWIFDWDWSASLTHISSTLQTLSTALHFTQSYQSCILRILRSKIDRH